MSFQKGNWVRYSGLTLQRLLEGRIGEVLGHEDNYRDEEGQPKVRVLFNGIGIRYCCRKNLQRA